MCILGAGISFNISTDSPIAVYVQIKNLVQFAIASGALAPDDALPSVRKLSEDVDINPNTVTKAYRDMELMGVVKTRRGVGVTITQNAASICSKAITLEAIQHLADAVAECTASGISAKRIREVVKIAIDDKREPYSS
jgi:GntR family transcriptional regulator